MSVTYATAQAAYLDNADYQETTSVTKAGLFITACRQLLAFPQASGKGSANVQFNMAQISAQLQEARRFVAQNSSTSATVGHPNFEGFRD